MGRFLLGDPFDFGGSLAAVRSVAIFSNGLVVAGDFPPHGVDTFGEVALALGLGHVGLG